MDRKFILEVIEKYRERPCLWLVSHPLYRNKSARNKALDELLVMFRSVDAHASRETVQAKLSSMRNSFNKEQRKVNASYTGDGLYLHVPKLWYYNYMKFLLDDDTPESSLTPTVCLMEDSIESSHEELMFCDDPESEDTTSSRSSRLRPIRPKQTANEVLDKTPKLMEQPVQSAQCSQKKQHDTFGEHVAEKLRSLPKSMVPYCQKLMNEAIFLAEIGHLNATSRIVSVDIPPPSQPTFDSQLTILGS